MKKRLVEFLLAHDDHTWDTIRVKVPMSVKANDSAFVEWGQKNILTQTRYRKCVLIAVYSYEG